MFAMMGKKYVEGDLLPLRISIRVVVSCHSVKPLGDKLERIHEKVLMFSCFSNEKSIYSTYATLGG